MESKRKFLYSVGPESNGVSAVAVLTEWTETSPSAENSVRLRLSFPIDEYRTMINSDVNVPAPSVKCDQINL